MGSTWDHKTNTFGYRPDSTNQKTGNAEEKESVPQALKANDRVKHYKQSSNGEVVEVNAAQTRALIRWYGPDGSYKDMWEDVHDWLPPDYVGPLPMLPESKVDGLVALLKEAYQGGFKDGRADDPSFRFEDECEEWAYEAVRDVLFGWVKEEE